jgi:hypothetical protein
MMSRKEWVTDCDYCGEISLCHEDSGRGTCCWECEEKQAECPHCDGEGCEFCGDENFREEEPTPEEWYEHEPYDYGRYDQEPMLDIYDEY